MAKVLRHAFAKSNADAQHNHGEDAVTVAMDMPTQRRKACTSSASVSTEAHISVQARKPSSHCCSKHLSRASYPKLVHELQDSVRTEPASNYRVVLTPMPPTSVLHP